MSDRSTTSTNDTPTDERRLRRILAADMRQLRDVARRLELPELASQLDNSLERLEQHRFTIAVVGEFKRGKSTLINALLGDEILPADVLPASATLNRVTYGKNPLVQILFRTAPDEPERRMEIAIEQLQDYVTKLTPEAEAIAATVREAIVYYPSPFCRTHETDLIDTPGFSDEAAMTEVTLEVLPRVDTAIMVTMADAPFAESEGELLDQLLAIGMRRVVFVVTALDRIRRAADRPRVVQNISTRISARIQRYAEQHFAAGSAEYQQFMKQAGTPRVYGISGYQALEARRTNDAELEQESGFSEFVAALDRFLARESEGLAMEKRAAQIAAAGAAIEQRIARQSAGLAARRQASATREEQINSLYAALQSIGAQEQQRLSSALEQARTVARATLGRFVDALKVVVASEITTQSFTASEIDTRLLNLQQMLVERLQQRCDAVREEYAIQLRADVQAVLDTALGSLLRFGIALQRVIQHASESASEPIASTFQPLMQRLEVSAGFDQPPSSPIAPASLLPLLTLAPAWLQGIVTAPELSQITSIPANENALRRSWRHLDLVEKYKTALHISSQSRLDQYARDPQLDLLLGNWLQNLFEAPRRELQSALDELQGQRQNLRLQRERMLILLQREQSDLEQQRSDIAQIRLRAQELATRLAQSG